VDVMVSIGSNFFYTVTLPCTLWFFDKRKKGTDREIKVLFIDARNIYRQIDRAHREFTKEQLQFISNIVRQYRGEQNAAGTLHEKSNNGLSNVAEPSDIYDSSTNGIQQPENMEEVFSDGTYQDIPGLCKVATIGEIEEQGWSLNPGRYVGVAEMEVDDLDFKARLKELYEELELLNSESTDFEEKIKSNIQSIIE